MTAKLNILQRLAAVQGEIDYIQKTKNKGMMYSAVMHDAVTAAVRPLMVKHGVLYYPSRLDVTQDGNRTQASMTVKFVNIEDKSDFVDVETIGYGIDAQDKGPGKAMSYCVKYALLKTLGLETGDDPDQDHHEKHEPEKQPVAAKSKAEARPEYFAISEGIRVILKTGGVDDLEAWWEKHVKEIKTWDAGWKKTIIAEFDIARDELLKVPA